MPLVVSVTVTSVNWTVIGGLHDGWNVAVSVRLNSALPFWTGKSPSLETSSLLTAFGWLPPPLMQSAVAVTTMCTCASSPSPASLPDTVRLSPVRVTVTVLETKCGLPAHAAGTASASALTTSAPRSVNRIREPPSVPVRIREEGSPGIGHSQGLRRPAHGVGGHTYDRTRPAYGK